MAVYEERNGVLTLVQGDKTLADIQAEVNAQNIEVGMPVSSCIKDTLASLFDNPNDSEEV